MINKIWIYIFIIMFLGTFIKIEAQTQSLLDGIWRSNTTGYNEFIGEYKLSQILYIQNNNFIWMEERIGERTPYWTSGVRGSFMIKYSKITFLEEERTYGQWDLRWEIGDGINIYTFYINNNILILTQDNEIIIFEKD